MNTQEAYLKRQLSQVVQEMKNLELKNKRIMQRYQYLQSEKVALEADLQGLSKSTVRKMDLHISQVRKNHGASSRTEKN